LTVTVVSDREFVAALLASSLFESAQALVTLAVRPTDRSTTATRCFALWTTHAPRPSPTHHALFPFFAPHFRATLCRIETIRDLIYFAIELPFRSFFPSLARLIRERLKTDFPIIIGYYIASVLRVPRTSARTTLHSSTENPPEEETSAIQILLGVGGRCCRVGRAAVLPRDAL